MSQRAVVVVAAALTLVACAPTGRPVTVISPSTSPSIKTTVAPSASPVVVRYRLERRATDAGTAGFQAVVRATLTDPRGWQRGDVRMVEDARAPYLVVLAEPDETQRLCRPYDVYRRYSCQNGPVVALNAERWRKATPEWTGTLAAYRQMLVNHEVGHLLGLHHPDGPPCPHPGQLARVMAQQSTELNGCLPNPWPLPSEIAVLAQHRLPLAPPPQPNVAASMTNR
ncbi:MAG: putative rane protein [Frankiales bacterium]|nr:putative rane protein [Frankiales bacterium]